jgi:hypothetical protein
MARPVIHQTAFPLHLQTNIESVHLEPINHGWKDMIKTSFFINDGWVCGYDNESECIDKLNGMVILL